MSDSDAAPAPSTPPSSEGNDGTSLKPTSERSAKIQAELRACIADVLGTLQNVSRGDLSGMLETTFPETHPVGALVESVNSMIADLVRARQSSATQLRELSERIETIEKQREAIRNLSVPVIEIWSSVLCVPVVGTLDTVRANDVTTTLLSQVVSKKARYAIIDVTGIEVMDTQSVDYFMRMARSIALLGAQCALSGMHPNIALTIVQMGVELDGLKCYRNMRDALRGCVLQESHYLTVRNKKRK